MWLHFDDIIYQLQRGGGASTYWQEMTSRVAADPAFDVQRTAGSKWQRVLPVPTSASIFHSSHFRVPLSRKTLTVTTIYDLTYELGFIRTKGSALNIWERKQAAYRADAIICISKSTRHDLLMLYPDLTGKKPVYAIPLASSHNPSCDADAVLSPRLADVMHETGEKFVLYVGTRAYYKNFNAALLGFSKSRLPAEGYSLVCTGPALSAEEQLAIKRLAMKEKVISVERASSTEMNQLYQMALALVYPSHYEGFGLPILEAMANRCSVIAANTSCLPEVVGDAGILIDPDKPEEISMALETLMDASVRQNLIALGMKRAGQYSWDKTAEQHKSVYRSLLVSST